MENEEAGQSKAKRQMIVKSPTTVNETQPINDTRTRRFLVLAAVKLFPRVNSSLEAIPFLSDKLWVKYGNLRNLAEASTPQFISQHTSIPVPKVYCAFTRKGETYIVMEKIRGEILGKGWVNRSDDSKPKLFSQLRGIVKDMRAILPPKGQGVSNVNGGPIYNTRLTGKLNSHGPLKDIHDFHRYTRQGLEADPNHDPEVSELIALQDRAWPPVLTYGDLSSLNILVRDDTIVGIIGWEMAGWYPSYWEYVTASQVNPWNLFWIDEIDKFLDPMPEEFRMDQIRQK
jgi:hypothetical protein